MKLLSLLAENFRCYSHATFNFSDETVIRAFNRSGKSTIAECIIWCLFGTDGDGKKKADSRLLRTGEKRMSVMTTWRTDAGEEITICRTKPETGAVSVTINGRRAKPGQLEGWFGSVGDFLSIFRPGHFGNLDPIDARSVLANCVPDIPDAQVMACLVPSLRALLQHDNIAFGIDSAKVLEKKVRAEISEHKDELVRLEGEARAFRDILEQGPPSTAERDAQVAKLCEQRKTLRSAFRTLRDSLITDTSLPCPTCGQDLPNDKAEAIRQARNTPIEERLKEICEQGDRLSKSIERLQMISIASEHSGEAVPTKLEAGMRHDEEPLTAYEMQLRQYERANASLQQTEQDKVLIEQELVAHQNKLKAIHAFQSQYVRMQHAKLNSFFENVEIRLQSINQETGEIRDNFAVFFKSTPYKSLCDSDEIRCDVEIGRVLATPRLESLPVFVDDAEGVQDLWSLGFPGQIIAAFVYPCALMVQSRSDCASSLLDEMKLMYGLVSQEQPDNVLHPAS